MVNGYSCNLCVQVWGGMSWREELLLWSRTGCEPQFPPPPGSCISQCCGSAGRHCFDADLDPIFHFDAYPDPDIRIGIKIMPIHIRILPQVLYKLEKLSKIFLLLFLVMPVYYVFLFSSVANVSLNIFGSGSGYLGCRSRSQTGSATWCVSDPIRIWIHNTGTYLFSGCSGSITFTTGSVSDTYYVDFRILSVFQVRFGIYSFC